MARRIANVWAAACPKCHVEPDVPCRNLATARWWGMRSELYGRRTHRERARRARELGLDRRETAGEEARRRHRVRRERLYQQFQATPYNWNDLTIATQQRILVNQAERHYGGRAWDIPIPTYTELDQAGLIVDPYITTGTIQPTVAYTVNTADITGWAVTRDEIWGAWTQTMTTTTGAYTRVITDEQRHVWGQWNVLPVQEAIQVVRQEAAYAELQAQRDEMQRARERRNHEMLQREQELIAVRERAQERGSELFWSLLTPQQRVDWEREGQVLVRGSEGGLYVLSNYGVHGNIRQTDEHGCRLATLCVAPQMRGDDGRALPMADGHVGQLLAIRHNEGELRRYANFSSQQLCREPDVPVLREPAA